MTIARHRISLSLARHPSIEGRHVIETLEPIPYMPIDRSVMSKAIFQTRKEKIRSQIGKISKDYKVSGYIVGWPLEPSGRPGAACGRVLHILDFLAGEFVRILSWFVKFFVLQISNVVRFFLYIK